MKKVDASFIVEGGELYFNIAKLTQLEALLEKPIVSLFANLTGIGITEIVKILTVGMSGKRKTEMFYMDRLQELLDEGYSIEQIQLPCIRALVGSGIFGKEAYYNLFPEEKLEEDDAEIKTEKNA